VKAAVSAAIASASGCGGVSGATGPIAAGSTARQRDPRPRRQRIDGAVRLDPHRRLGQRREQRLMVDPHLHGAAAQRRGHFVGQRDHRRPVERRAADPRRQIGRPRPEGAEADPRHARQPPAHIGHEARAAFVAGQHEIDAVGGADRLHIIDPAAARHAEDMAHSHVAERANDIAGNIGRFHARSFMRALKPRWE